MAGSYRAHFFHLVWSTKGRRDLILPNMRSELYAYIGGIVRADNGNLMEIGGTANHVHLLIQLSNLDGYTSLIRNVKASSSNWMKRKFNSQDFSWQDGYGSFSLNCSLLDKVRAYIQNQEQHHQKYTFEEEYRKFLSVHGILFEERYLFS